MLNTEIIKTSDGSNTLYVRDLDEQYHSVHGAVTESGHVFIKNGWLALGNQPRIVVFEVGLGTGLNCLLTALKAFEERREVTYYALEKYPLSPQIISGIGYGELFGERGVKFFEKIHKSNWNEKSTIFPGFSLMKIETDLLVWEGWEGIQSDLVYFDAFGPDKQPEMWTPEIFMKISSLTRLGGIIVTYAAKGEVRRRMTSAGFVMERLPGPPGKREMLRGIRK